MDSPDEIMRRLEKIKQDVIEVGEIAPSLTRAQKIALVAELDQFQGAVMELADAIEKHMESHD